MFDRTFSGELGPNFAQLKHIGVGGDGSIYSGFDRRFDFPVCIKRVSVSNKNDCRAALREIRIRRRIRHENILGLLNIVTSDGTEVCRISPTNFHDTSCIYFVQALLDADLRQIIENNKRLGDDYVKLFFYQLLRGLKYIHSANVLHRDLKPSNVLVNVNSLELMISDFGHAVVLDPDFVHTNEQVSCNTSLWYKAPELILGSSRYSTASDMWAVGCILGEMLLGRPLFEGENDLEQLELIIHTIKVNAAHQTYVRQFLTEEVNRMYDGKPKFPLPSKFHNVDMQALHLLERLLEFDSRDRVTAEMALTHPFLDEYACAADEPQCVKSLHVEHEVDDFLEYTLKDLIVGECMTLADEQPRIHMQMSSYSSIMDIVKELNKSPNQSASQSHDDGGKGNVIIKVTSDEGDAGMFEEDGRFKVLEVLKEEHTSSSDSTGVASHEESVKEEPLVSDHAAMVSSHRFEHEHHNKIDHHRRHSHHRRKTSADENGNGLTPPVTHDERVSNGPLVSDQAATLCSERWKNERHKMGHRRHHGHHRRKSSKVSNKNHKSEIPDSDGNNMVRRISPESSSTESRPGIAEKHPSGGEEPATPSNVEDDDKVETLINKSKKLISSHKLGPEDGQSGEVNIDDDVDELIKRSNQLIADQLLSESSVDNVNSVNVTFDDDGVSELINRSNQLLAGLDPDNAQDATAGTEASDIAASASHQNNIRSLCELENESAGGLSVAELIRRSRELLGEFEPESVPQASPVTQLPMNDDTQGQLGRALDATKRWRPPAGCDDADEFKMVAEKANELLRKSEERASSLPKVAESDGVDVKESACGAVTGSKQDELVNITTLNNDIGDDTCYTEDNAILADQQAIVLEEAMVKYCPDTHQSVVVPNTVKVPSSSHRGDRYGGGRSMAKPLDIASRFGNEPDGIQLGSSYRHRGTVAEHSRNDVSSSGVRTRNITGSMNDYRELGTPMFLGPRDRPRYSDRVDQRRPYERHYHSTATKPSERREHTENIHELGLTKIPMEPKFNTKDIGSFRRTNCRNVEKTARDNQLLPNEDFYDPINTLMNRTRTYRERLHEPFSF